MPCRDTQGPGWVLFCSLYLDGVGRAWAGGTQGHQLRANSPTGESPGQVLQTLRKETGYEHGLRGPRAASLWEAQRDHEGAGSQRCVDWRLAGCTPN